MRTCDFCFYRVAFLLHLFATVRFAHCSTYTQYQINNPRLVLERKRVLDICSEIIRLVSRYICRRIMLLVLNFS